MEGHSRWHYVRLVTSCIGVSVGLLACIAFSTVYVNTLASVFAFLSALFAALCLILHVLHHKNVLQVWHSPDTLRPISMMGFFVFVIGFALTVWYIFIGLYRHRSLMPVEDNPYITAVWTFMTCKWGLLVWSCSRMYSEMIFSDSLLDCVLHLWCVHARFVDVISTCDFNTQLCR